ncbi:MAG: aspartate carbamoyltransferase [Acetanaerobacterium sp.]
MNLYMMNLPHLIDLDDLQTVYWDRLITLAGEISSAPSDYYGRLEGKIMATLFYEPSTRTQMSFQTAMFRLGGKVIGFDNPLNSSVAKGESLKDTVKIMSGYADILVIRHPSEGSAKAASIYSGCPVINAGDGGHLHPTQTLTDLVTLKQEKGRLHDLVIGVCGDLKNGRTVHSLIKAMARFQGNRFVLISTQELRIPSYLRTILEANGCPYEEVFSLEEAMAQLDVLYMTRIQKERFASEQEYESQKNVYTLDPEKLNLARFDLKIMHPLPRVDEITDEVDSDPRAIYFKQAEYGIFARMALILMLFDGTIPPSPDIAPHPRSFVCANERCITRTEGYLPNLYTGTSDMLECRYCSGRILI